MLSINFRVQYNGCDAVHRAGCFAVADIAETCLSKCCPYMMVTLEMQFFQERHVLPRSHKVEALFIYCIKGKGSFPQRTFVKLSNPFSL